ncbi:MAG: hypothetical protein ACOVPA_20500 [Rubrivivax sp.]
MPAPQSGSLGASTAADTGDAAFAAGRAAGTGHGGAVTPIQRFGSAANLNILSHDLVLDGV